MKEFNEYQRFTESLARYNIDVSAMLPLQSSDRNPADPTQYEEIPMPFIYPVLALAEESGEVCGKLAKFVRKYGDNVEELRKAVLPELGDALYQLSECARQFGFTLQQVAEANVEKLTDRNERGVLIGEGDNR